MGDSAIQAVPDTDNSGLNESISFPEVTSLAFWLSAHFFLHWSLIDYFCHSY